MKNKMNFAIIHGVYSNPDSNWFPWLRQELEKKKYDVISPKFPTPIGQSLESWMDMISKFEGNIDEGTVMVGHSLGAAFIINYLEQSKKKIKAAILVAGFHRNLKSPYDVMNRTFINKNFDWEKIRANCGKILAVASDNDEFIPMEISKELAKNLGAELEIVHNGGHLNLQSGYKEFPLLLNLIETV